MARRHEQAVALRSAEADVGRTLGQTDVADRRAFRVEDENTVEVGGPHAPAAPQIAIDIDAEAVGCFRLGADDELPRIGELGPGGNIERVYRRRARLPLDLRDPCL